MHFKEYKSVLSSAGGTNFYRGCDHGCIYCDSRSTCYQMDHDFEDIEVKLNVPQLLDAALKRKRAPIIVGTGSMSDPYNHVEAELGYTRQCLEVILKNHCGIAIQTKSNLILRDMDLLEEINRVAKATVEITLTTADENLCRILEPNVSTTRERVEVLKECHRRGIRTVVWMCPFLPYINDTRQNIEALLDYCTEAHVWGIIFFGVGVTLRDGNRQYFYQKLDEHFPGLKAQYTRRYGDAYEVSSDHNAELCRLFFSECKRRGIETDNGKIFEYLRTYPEKNQQISLF